MTNGRQFAFSCLLISILTACAADKGSEDDLTGPADVTSFAIVEGSSTLRTGVSIRVQWAVKAPKLFQIELHLSRDATLDDADEKLLGFGCGASSTNQPAECSGSSVCTVEAGQNGSTLRCGDPASPIPTPVALSSILGADESAVLILRACNALFEGCDTATIPVTFAGG